jgi:hypothetical protein
MKETSDQHMGDVIDTFVLALAKDRCPSLLPRWTVKVCRKLCMYTDICGIFVWLSCPV